jgi:hypothetical protein
MSNKVRFISEHPGSFARRAAKLAKRPWLVVLLGIWACPSYADPAPSPTTAAPAYPAMAPVDQYMMDQAAEIASARTAAPAAVSDKAEILVLGRHGYETAVKGSNGFVCFVERSWADDFDHAEFWNQHRRMPQCWNAAAASSELPEYLKRTQWVLAGVTKEEIAARTKAAWASHEFGPPAPGSMVYMMSKEQYILDVPPGHWQHWYPHVMFYVPAVAGPEGSAWGANVPGSPIFSTTSDMEPITTYFVIGPKWSDGTLGPYVAVPAATTVNPETHHH